MGRLSIHLIHFDSMTNGLNFGGQKVKVTLNSHDYHVLQYLRILGQNFFRSDTNSSGSTDELIRFLQFEVKDNVT